MRVICVRDFLASGPLVATAEVHPQVGDEDVVIRTEVQMGITFYALERFGLHHYYRSTFFATLPSSTADEMAEAERESILM